MEIRAYPVLKRLSVTLTDCRLWLEGQDFLSLGENSDHNIKSTDGMTWTGSLQSALGMLGKCFIWVPSETNQNKAAQELFREPDLASELS